MMLVGFQEKQVRAQGELKDVVDLNLEDKNGVLTARSWHSIGHYGFEDWSELIDRQVWVRLISKEKNGKMWHSLDDIQHFNG